MTRKRSHEGTPQSQAQTVSPWDGSLEPELSVLWTTFPFNLACLGEPGASVLQQPALTDRATGHRAKVWRDGA